jgi:receptor protein-tyrosine kinase
MAAYRASRARLDEMLETLGKQHDLVKAAERQVRRTQEDLQAATHDTATSYTELLKQSQRIAEARVKELQTAMTDASSSAVALYFKQAEYEQLKKEEERITRSLELLDSRIKEINVNEDVGSITVSVLEVGKPAFTPVRPVQSKILGMGLVGGLMAGMGLAMLRDLVDQRLRSADEITALLDLPIIGVIPHMHARGKGGQTARTVDSDPRSNVAEAYRTLRTAVYFGTKEGAAAKTILVTSPAPGDGKSTCSSNLALAFAQSGRRTLLIDADCRRPTQDRNYDLPVGAGIADVLVGQVGLKDAIRKSGVDNLDLLVGGMLPPNPAELLDSQALLNLFGQVSEMYDQIVIDSPPIVPVTDARILAASCDAAIMVLRAERSTRRMAEHAREAMHSVGANLLGVVVNDVPRGKDGYGYDYYGYGRYGYRSARNGNLADGQAAHGALLVSSHSIGD